MRHIVILILILVSCKSASEVEAEKRSKSETSAMQDTNFKKLPSSNKTYTLHYKILLDNNSPVQWYTYFVTNASTQKIVKKEEKVMAEKIYWKNNNTLAIVPYTEVIQQSTEVGKETNNEILINIK